VDQGGEDAVQGEREVAAMRRERAVAARDREGSRGEKEKRSAWIDARLRS
jgi:hypothetical protein